MLFEILHLPKIGTETLKPLFPNCTYSALLFSRLSAKALGIDSDDMITRQIDATTQKQSIRDAV